VRSTGIVLNLGLKSIRAIAFDNSGRKLAFSARPVGTLLRGERIEQDPEEWWSKAQDVLREVAEETSPDHAFLTITASSACLVAISESGKSLRRAVMVSDRRASAQAERLAGLTEFAAVCACNPSLSPDPYYLLPKAMWIAEEEPEVMRETRWLLTPADYLGYMLTGECGTDPLNAEKFYFDAVSNSYPYELVSAAGIDERCLPAVLPMGERLGCLREPAARSVGLRKSLPVVISTYDAICAFWGSGVSEPGDVADVSGTVTSIRMLSDRPMSQGETRVFSQSMPGTEHFVVGGSNNLGGGLVEWLKQSFYPQTANPYDAILSDAAESGTGARGVIFLPYLLGERCPLWDAHARGVFFGLERHHERCDFARAVCESAAFSVENILQVLRGHGARPNRLRVSGGLARLGLINEIKADVTGLPTEVVAEFETTAIGAMMIAGTGCGWFDSLSQATQVVRIREIIVPDRTRHEAYGEWFGLYQRLYGALRESFVERTAIAQKVGLGGVGRLENL